MRRRSDSLSLVRQPRRAERTTKFRRKLRRAIDAGELPAEAEGGLQFEHTRRRSPRFIEPAERNQGPNQDDVVDAMGGVRLHRLVGSFRGLVQSALLEMAERLRAECRERP